MTESRYGNIINQRKFKEQTSKPENQIEVSSENQIAINPENQIGVNPENQIAINPENQIGVSSENQIAINPENQIETKMVNLCVKVPEAQRRHWAASAKSQGITMTEVIIEALTNKFGLPS